MEKEDEKELNDIHTDNQQPTAEAENETEASENQLAEQETTSAADELAEMKDKYIRLFSEFENFRRRTAKEKIELIKSASEDLMVSLLPVMDDLERGMDAMSTQTDIESVKEGVSLIHNKLKKTLENKGLKPMDSAKGADFNTELHEAITQIPVQEESLKGKVVDTVEKGYYLNEKVIRFAKVVIGSKD